MTKGFSGLTDAVKKLTRTEPEKFLRTVAITAFSTIVRRSPVDTGRFRGNWRVGINRIDHTYDPEGYATTSRGTRIRPQQAIQAAEMSKLADVRHSKWGDNIFISNETPYAEFLEEGRSPQAPTGVLHVTAAEMRARFKI